jgi:plastocyanin
MPIRRLTRLLATVALAAGVAGLAPRVGHASIPNSKHLAHVTIQNFRFVPARLTITAGTTVVWTNKDAAAHTVTVRGGKIDSGALTQGKRFVHTFTRPGTYHYICAIHPFMAAIIIVRR